MGYKDITEGVKVGRAKAARFIQSKSGTPGIEVLFEFEEKGGSVESLNYVAWLSEKARKNAMETLTNVLGCNGNDAVDSDGVFTDPQFLDYGREVKLTVNFEDAQNADGTPKIDDKTGEVKRYPRIQWVNSMAGSAYKNVAPEVVKSELSKVGFKAMFLAAKKQGGGAAGAPQPTPNSANDIPF